MKTYHSIHEVSKFIAAADKVTETNEEWVLNFKEETWVPVTRFCSIKMKAGDNHINKTPTRGCMGIGYCME